MSKPSEQSPTAVLTFERFWRWVQRHPNCILRVATPEVVVYDDEDLHWHFDRAEGGLAMIEVIRGKRLMADIAVQSTDVELVQSSPGEENEFVFDLYLQGDDATPAYSFVMSHGYEDEGEGGDTGRWVH